MRLENSAFSKCSKSGFFIWNLFFFRKKMFFVKKNSNFSKNAVECDWINKSSRNVLNLRFLMEKYCGFFEKRKVIFTKIAERSKLAVKCDWKSKTSQNVQKMVLINKLYRFFGKTKDFLKKTPKIKISYRMQLN